MLNAPVREAAGVQPGALPAGLDPRSAGLYVADDRTIEESITMPTTAQPPKPLLFTDPNREPIRAVDQITFHRSASSHLDITCCAHVVSALDQNNVVTESIVTARLRMDLTMAQALLDGLTKQIAMTEAANSPVN